MPEFALGEKMMTPSRFQSPLRPDSAAQMVVAGEPARSIFFSFPSAKNAMCCPSGDQKGQSAYLVPGRARAWSESAFEQPAARQHLVQHASEGPDIGPP